MPCSAVVCYAMRYAGLGYAMLCYAMPCYAWCLHHFILTRFPAHAFKFKKASLLCAGWKAILLTWAWALAIWQLADFAKFLASWVLHKAEDIQADCRHTEEPLPSWVKAVNAPGVAGDRLMRMAYKPVKVREPATAPKWY